MLYVSDIGNHAIEVLKYRRWKNIESIDSNGQPMGTWVDTNGNFYVADGGNVAEYNPSGNQIFTYSSRLNIPEYVTGDKRGNVYVADNLGAVAEYPQGSNNPVYCSLGSYENLVNGIAVDKDGDVFALALVGTGYSASLIEYPRGLSVSGCRYTVLTTGFQLPGNLEFDPQGNLLVPDANAFAIDVVAPPYTKITGTFGSWDNPLCITIDKAGTQAYVTDSFTQNVTVLTYPGGSVLTTLGSANGLSNPWCAVDSKNYIL